MTITINRRPGFGAPIVLDLETLAGADLSRADMRGATLRGADLIGAHLHGADLHGADMRGADMRGAYLRDATLRGAYLYGANLSGADLDGANLHGANLWGADLWRADLRGAKIDDDTIASVVTYVGRSDGHEFIAFRLDDGSVKIMAGCRWLTPDDYRAHAAAEYPGTDRARETLDIIEFIERRAAA